MLFLSPYKFYFTALKMYKRRFIVFLVLASCLFLCDASDDNKCSEVEKHIQAAKKEIQDEKELTPKGKLYYTSMDPMSISGVEERYGDMQRIFEKVADKLNVNELPDDRLNMIKQDLLSCPSFQSLVDECQSHFSQPTCDRTSPYRTIDGTCNNLKNPTWGAIYDQFRRLMPAVYTGLYKDRESVLGGDLPQPRDLSLNIFHQPGHPSPNISHMFTFFGQIIAHDASEATLPKLNGKIPPCCPREDCPYCDPIRVKKSDPFYSKYNVTCVLFIKNPPLPTCSFGKRQYFNGVPGFFDAHLIYGRTEEETKELREENDSGRLKTQATQFGSLPVGNVTEDDQFCRSPSPTQCYFGGDSRVNQHTPIMSLQTLLLREHNRIADGLKVLNLHWNGERIFQTARKILGAELQNIIYQGYLPLLLGDNLLDQHDLRVGSKTKNHYDKTVSPSVSNEFSAVTFRLHSFINSKVGNIGCSRTSMKKSFLNTEYLRQGCLADFLGGACRSPQQVFDHHFVEDVTNFLYSGLTGIGDMGLDIAAIDIKRGRDRGMPPYADFVHYWSGGNITINSFDDFEQILSKENVEILKNNYKHPRDVDTWAGMAMEKHVPGALTGPTVLSIAVDHFSRQKKGDRFYFENQGLSTSFSTDQIKTIKKTSLSKIICDNTDVKTIPKNAFLLPCSKNPIVRCSKLPVVDLTLWKA